MLSACSPLSACRKFVMFALAAIASLTAISSSTAQEANWIWTSRHEQGSVPEASCYFRKTFRMQSPEGGQITVGADDAFEIYVNGTRVNKGVGYTSLTKIDISKRLRSGRNMIAIKVDNRNGNTAAIAARVQVKDKESEWVSHSTDATWKAELSPFPLWMLPVYNDNGWAAAADYGPLGKTAPWDRTPDAKPEPKKATETVVAPVVVQDEDASPTPIAEEEIETYERFRVNREFTVQRVLSDESAGSLIAMTFNEFGQIIASREGGPLLLIVDTNDDQIPDTAATYCDKVTSCQGILSLNGNVFVTGNGPEGSALYRLSDKDRDGFLETVVTILKFTGGPSEHGPHGIALGPDGFLYITVGNHAGIDKPYHVDSPFKNFYEGDVVGPKYEDATGHAAGVKAPGGTIIRLPVDASRVELFAGGIRNAYDLAFDAEGELFVHDSDMESDAGMTWYRPTQVYHVLPGSEIGWRSGWSKWPEYWYDALPPLAETGRGSPTGAAVYNHYMFPTRYHNALFLADWSEGRILAVRQKRSGASYTATTETFLEGEPLNVTDLEVAPDGSIYFCTGGRGTSGGIYRIKWRGNVPEGMRDIGTGLTAAIRQPQLNSAWARQNIAKVRVEMKETWGPSLEGVARSETNPAWYRTRALDLMQLFGPKPSSKLLATLADDQSELVRRKAAFLMGLQPSDRVKTALVDMLDDSDRAVRCKAAEALARGKMQANFTTLIDMLASDDRHESTSARKLLETMPTQEWASRVLQIGEHRPFIQGGLALVNAKPTPEVCKSIVARCQEHMSGFVSDRDFVDMLRLVQVAAIQGELGADELETLGEQLAEEFPSGSSQMNRELMRLLARLQVSSIGDRYVSYLQSNVSTVDKTHAAMQMRFITSGWEDGQRVKVLAYLEQAAKIEEGASSSHYVKSATLDMAKTLTADEAWQVIAEATEMPTAAMGALYQLPAELDDAGRNTVIAMDKAIEDETGAEFDKLRIGVVAVLARSNDEESFGYLRDIWQRFPERRDTIAMGLAQKPDGENWGYILSSLPVLDAQTAAAVLKQLRTVPKRPSQPETYRQVILKGLELQDKGGDEAVALLHFWTGEEITSSDDDTSTALAAWQAWYARNYPDGPQATLPEATSSDHWDYDELLAYLGEARAEKSSAERGAAVYKKAQCASCHRHGRIGDSMGPDLTAVSKRFSRKEMLESIVYPSQVISDQYASKKILTESGVQYSGLVAKGVGGKITVMQSTGKKVELHEDDIDVMAPSKVSAMPEGLLNTLTLEEIADLFAFLQKSSASNVATRPR